MSSGYEIEWSARAVADVDRIVHYIEEEWGMKSTSRFIQTLQKEINRIRAFPYAFPMSGTNGVRRCVMSKQNTIYYQIRDSRVYLLSIFDNRRNPSDLEDIENV